MEITDRQEFTKFLPAAFMTTLLAELSLMRKEKSLSCSPDGFIEVMQNLVRMGCSDPEPPQKQCRKPIDKQPVPSAKHKCRIKTTLTEVSMSVE